jgi:hypothetical protein
LSTVSQKPQRGAEHLSLHVFSSVAGYLSGNISKRPYWELIPLSTSTTARTVVIELKEIENACDRMDLSNNRSSAAHEVRS